MKLNVLFFVGLQQQNVLIIFLFCMKHLYLLKVKITPDANSFLQFLKAVPELGDSLHVRSNFWYLIMTSTKLI